jgi:3-oxoacyl-[acyl-carrier-protein] synthase II
MPKIVFTGSGLITAAGAGVPATFAAIETGARLFTHRPGNTLAKDADLQPWPVAAVAWPDIGWPEGDRWANNKKYANFAGHAAIAVAKQAMGGHVVTDPALSQRCGIVIAVGSTNSVDLGISISKIAVMAETDVRPLATLMFDESPDFAYVRGIPSQIGQFVAMATGFRGSNVVVYGESSAGGLSALACATRLIESGEVDRVIVIGVAPHLAVGSLVALERQEDIACEAIPGCGPFDSARRGTLLGQSAVALLIEREDPALALLGQPSAELLACETLCAATRAQSVEFAVEAALGQSGTKPDLWWACGSGSTEADREECTAVGRWLARTPVTSSKGTIGNSFECSALVDIALAIEALQRERIPAIGLLKAPDPALGELDFVVGTSRPVHGARQALITSMGFGLSTAAGAVVLAGRKV